MSHTGRSDERMLMSFVVLVQCALQASLPMQNVSDFEQASIFTCCGDRFKVGLLHIQRLHSRKYMTVIIFPVVQQIVSVLSVGLIIYSRRTVDRKQCLC